MSTILNPVISNYNPSIEKPSVFSRFFNWCNNQQTNRLLWLGVALTAHGCILTPITISAVIFAGSNLYLFIAALIAMTMVLVSNLAALPTKITIPVFFFSILMDVAIVIATLYMGLNSGNVF
jgi:hypothetical protein